LWEGFGVGGKAFGEDWGELDNFFLRLRNWKYPNLGGGGGQEELALG